MRSVKTMIALVLAASLLAGCGTRLGQVFSGERGTPRVGDPAELTDFEPRLDVQTVWSRNLGSGERRLGLRMGPTLADGRVYAADVDGALFALDAATGGDIWRIQTDLPLSSAPGAGGGAVVAVSSNGDVVAYEADSGEERWRARVPSAVLAAPLVAQGTAVVRAANGRISGFDLATGQRRWIFERQVPALTLRGTSSPALGQGVAYVGYEDGMLVALRLQDGLRVWEQRVAEPEGRTEIDRMADIAGEVQVGLGEVFAASYGGQVMALQAQSGQPLWARDIQSYAGLALTGRSLLVGDATSTVWALDRNSSSALWQQDALANRFLTSPAVQGGHVVVGDLEGYVHWLNLETGELAARTRLSRRAIRATPRVSSDGIAYVVDTRGQLVAYRVSPR